MAKSDEDKSKRKRRRWTVTVSEPVHEKTVDEIIEDARRSANASSVPSGVTMDPKYFADSPGPEAPKQDLDDLERQIAETMAALAEAKGEEAPKPTKKRRKETDLDSAKLGYLEAQQRGEKDNGEYSEALSERLRELKKEIGRAKDLVKSQQYDESHYRVLLPSGAPPEPERRIIVAFTPAEVMTLVRWAKVAEARLSAMTGKPKEKIRVDRMDADSALSEQRLSWYIEHCAKWADEDWKSEEDTSE